MRFEWNARKAAANLRKHGVSLHEATSVFNDELAVTGEDEGATDELRPEYRREDFGTMVRGKYAARMKESSNVVVLDPDVAAAFPNAQAVNQALRALLEIAKNSVQLPAQSPSDSSHTP